MTIYLLRHCLDDGHVVKCEADPTVRDQWGRFRALIATSVCYGPIFENLAASAEGEEWFRDEAAALAVANAQRRAEITRLTDLEFYVK